MCLICPNFTLLGCSKAPPTDVQVASKTKIGILAPPDKEIVETKPLADRDPLSEGDGVRRPAEAEGRLQTPPDVQTKSAYTSEMQTGAAALYSGFFNEARERYLHAMELRPDKMSPALGALRTMVLKGYGEQRSGIAARIRQRADELAQAPKTSGAGQLLTARLAIALNKPGKALDMARLAVDRLPDLGVSWRVLGEAAMLAEQWGYALDAFQRAAELGLAAKSGTWERIADVLDELGDLEGAEEAARRALTLTGQDSAAKRRRLNLLAAILKHQGNLDSAWHVASEAQSLGHADPMVLHNLATIEEARGHSEEALALYLKALEKEPIPTTSWRLGHLLLKVDRKQEALSAFTMAVAHLDRWLWPVSTRWWAPFDVGRIYARSGYEQEAIGWFEDALRAAKTAHASRTVRGWLSYCRTKAGQDKQP